MIVAQCLLLVLEKAKQNKTNRNKTPQGMNQALSSSLLRDPALLGACTPTATAVPFSQPIPVQTLAHSTNIPIQAKLPKSSD